MIDKNSRLRLFLLRFDMLLVLLYFVIECNSICSIWCKITVTDQMYHSLVDDALRLLCIRKFSLAIHDRSFPSAAEEDIGTGSPYGPGGIAFLRFARSLGFNAVQLGPQGKTSLFDPSPYNGTLFSRNILSLSPLALARDMRVQGLISERDIDNFLSAFRVLNNQHTAGRTDYVRAHAAAEMFLDMVYNRFCALRDSGAELCALFDAFLARMDSSPVNWFERDCIYEALTASSGTDDWRLWGTPGCSPCLIDQRLYCPDSGEEETCSRRIRHIQNEYRSTIERFAFEQFLLRLQHQHLKAEALDLGMTLYGDMQVGCSHQDRWAWRALSLKNYLLGAPPSRTNSEGQPWGYPVLDPHKICTVKKSGKIKEGPALAFIEARIEKLLEDFDGIRIDHPQGIVCPWVYRADDPDPFHAVQNGARLYSSPDMPDHPALRPFSLVTAAQLNHNPDYPPYGDEQVTALLPEQIDRFAVVLDAILRHAQSRGRRQSDILCEVLSTWPMPLKAVMRQRNMGRFCITQKADPLNPDDVYRGENTSPADWIMVGSHDTKPLWLVVDERKATSWMRDRAELLARRIVPDAGAREAFAAHLASDQCAFCEAMFAELFLGPAQHVSVFFTDLFGMKQPYNEPGTNSGHNWTLRVPADYETLYYRQAEQGKAFNIRRALALALKAKAETLGGEAVDLAGRLSGKNR